MKLQNVVPNKAEDTGDSSKYNIFFLRLHSKRFSVSSLFFICFALAQ
jgi:hypothetical protein